jgi:hypothetical protein
MQKFQTAITGPTGNVIPNAVITIITLGGSPATIYAGNGVSPYPSNQVTTNSQGEFSFYAANGRYSYTVAATNFVTEVYTDFLLNDPANPDPDPGDGGFWPDVTPTARIWRLRDRLFINDGAAFTGNRYGTQSGFVPTGVEGANWAPRDSMLFVASDSGKLAVTGFTSNENLDPANPTATIGVSGFVINNKASRSAWALYADIQHEVGINSYGLEVAGKNKSGNSVPTPYGLGTGVYGVWLSGGGDPVYGGAPTNPSTAGVVFKKNGSTWNVGIVFEDEAITGTDGTTGTGVAVALAKGHELQWYKPDTSKGLTIRGDQTTGESQFFIIGEANAINLAGAGELPVAKFLGQASSVNYFEFLSAITANLITLRATGSDTNVGIQFRVKGTQSVRFQSQNSGSNEEFRIGGVNSAPVNFLRAYGTNSGSGLAVLDAQGTDTNISIRITPKGTGTVSFGTWTSNADAAVNGYVTITDSSGNTRKLATIA